jgi:hypothetical protein
MPSLHNVEVVPNAVTLKFATLRAAGRRCHASAGIEGQGRSGL